MKSVLIIAHRGASAVAPESTRAAIRAAVKAGARMIELDVQMTRDGRLVVFHDSRLERTTNGKGLLAHTPYSAVARLEAGEWFHPRFKGERILLVSQAIRAVPSPVWVNFEVKRTPLIRALILRLARLIRSSGASKRVLVSSFDPKALKPLATSRLSRALISRSEPERSLREALRLGCVSWHPLHTTLTEGRIAQAHAAGLRVYPWTVDEAACVRRLLRWGVDGFFTNNPGKWAHLARAGRIQ